MFTVLVPGTTLTFEMDNSIPVTRRGTLWEYTYSCRFNPTTTLKMQACFLNDAATGAPKILDTITIANIDYIPLVCKLDRRINRLPLKITVAKDSSDSISFHKYVVEVL